MSKPKVLIIGDAILDEYIIGNVNRMSPEADVPVVNEISRDYRLGGAINVAANLMSLGTSCHLISVVGDDDCGERMSDICAKQKISCSFLKDYERPTTCKTRVVNENFVQLLRIDNESTKEISESIEMELKQLVVEILNNQPIEAMLLQDYNKGVLTKNLIIWLQDICVKQKIKLFVDPKKDNFEVLSQCYLFKPNLKECRDFIGGNIELSTEEIIKITKERITGPQNLVITLGSKGMFYSSDTEGGFLEAYKLSNPDVSGAGDSVIAALCHYDLVGIPLSETVIKANKAGGISCSKKGVSIVMEREIDELGKK